jgi:DNA-binding FadR family transcriptional regulator
MIRPVSRAVLKAEKFLRKHIDKEITEENPVLPPLKKLCGDAGVSYVTMWHAVQKLKNEGLLLCARGHPVIVRFAKQSREQQAYVSAGETLWLSVKKKISDDIANGRYAPSGFLPPIKELKKRYNASYPTIRKALNALVAEKVVLQELKKYRVRSGKHYRHQMEIILLGLGGKNGMIAPAAHDENILTRLEAQCSQAGIKLTVKVFFTDKDGRPRFARTNARPDSEIADNPGLLGHIYLLSSYDPHINFISYNEELFNQVALIKKPFAILDETGIFQLPPPARKKSHIRLFKSTFSAQAAESICEALVKHGHRNIAFISHLGLDSPPWVRSRLNQLQESFRRHGNVTLKSFIHERPIKKALEMHERANKLYHSWISSWPKDMFVPELRELAGGFVYGYVNKLRRRGLNSLFSKALSDKKITAWITIMSWCALDAYEFCAGRGIKMPDDISLISFDNSLHALQREIAVYDSNANETANALLNYMLQYRILVKAKNQVVDLPGILIERKSLGPARKRKRR